MESRGTEMGFLHKLGTWVIRKISECRDRTGKDPMPPRWVECNKGDAEHVEVRSRFVVCETNRVTSIMPGDIAAVFSSTPPLEALRVLCSLCMTLPLVDHEPWVLMFLDVSRAHPHCPVLRENLYVKLPPEAKAASDECGLLLKCLYGLKDANQAYEFLVKASFEGLGFDQGVYTPCVYAHPKTDPPLLI